MRAHRLRLKIPGLIAALLLMSAMCSLIAGCFSQTRVTEKKFVIVHPGKPLQLLEIGPKKTIAKTIDGTNKTAEIDTEKLKGGTWMDPDHWRVIDKKLRESLKKAIKEDRVIDDKKIEF